MSKNTQKGKSRTLLKDFAVLGLLALLGIGEIVSWVIGVADQNSPKAWIALIGAVILLGGFIFSLVAVIYRSLLARRR